MNKVYEDTLMTKREYSQKELISECCEKGDGLLATLISLFDEQQHLEQTSKWGVLMEYPSIQSLVKKKQFSQVHKVISQLHSLLAVYSDVQLYDYKIKKSICEHLSRSFVNKTDRITKDILMVYKKTWSFFVEK